MSRIYEDRKCEGNEGIIQLILFSPQYSRDLTISKTLSLYRSIEFLSLFRIREIIFASVFLDLTFESGTIGYSLE